MPIKGKKKRALPKVISSTGPRDPNRLDYSHDDDLVAMPPPPAASLPMPPPLDSKDYQAAIKAHLNEFDDLASRATGLNGPFPHAPPTDLLTGSAPVLTSKKTSKRASRNDRQDGSSRDRNGNGRSGDQIWNTTTTEERERIKDFWLNLGEDERKSLVRVEKEAVLKKMKEQQKHSCSCSVCGRKRTAIEEELEVLYDAYYEELEQYANRQQRFPSTHRAPSPPPPMRSGPGATAYRDPNLSRPPRPGKITEILHSDDELGSYDEDEEGDYLSEDNYSDIDDTEDGFYEDDRAPSEFFRFGNSLTVKGGILTVADDLLKNDGKKFIEMMEQLAERRMQREEEAMLEAREFDEEDDDEDYDDDDLDSEDYDEEDEEEQDVLTEEQRMAEGRRMFQIFAARMFEQRVLTAYREQVAQERQAKLLEELEAEDTREREREAKKLKDSQKKKEKKKAQQQKKEEERARKEADRLAAENKAKEEAERKAEEARKKKEEQRLKKEAERKAAEAERLRRDEEKKKRLMEEQARQETAVKERKQKAEQLRRDLLAKEVATRDSRLKRAEAKLTAHDAKVAAKHADRPESLAQQKAPSVSAPRTAEPIGSTTGPTSKSAQTMASKVTPAVKAASPAVTTTAPAVPRTQTPAQSVPAGPQPQTTLPQQPQQTSQAHSLSSYAQTPWAPPAQSVRPEQAGAVGQQAHLVNRSITPGATQTQAPYNGTQPNGYGRQAQAQPPAMPMPLPPPGMSGVRGHAVGEPFGFGTGPSGEPSATRSSHSGLAPPGVSYPGSSSGAMSMHGGLTQQSSARPSLTGPPASSSRFGVPFGGSASGPSSRDEAMESDHVMRRTSMFEDGLGSIGRPSPSRLSNSVKPVAPIGRPAVGPPGATYDNPWSASGSQRQSPSSHAQTQTAGSSLLFDSLHQDTGIDDILGSRVLNEDDEIVLDNHPSRTAHSALGNGGASFGSGGPSWQSFNNMISPGLAGSAWTAGGHSHGYNSVARYVPAPQQCRAGCRQVYTSLRGALKRPPSLFGSASEHDAPFVPLRRLHEAYQDTHPDHIVDEQEILAAAAQPGNTANGGGIFQIESTSTGDYMIRYLEDAIGGGPGFAGMSSHQLSSPAASLGSLGAQGQQLRTSPPQVNSQPGSIGAGRWGLAQASGASGHAGKDSLAPSAAGSASSANGLGPIGQGIFQPLLSGAYNPFQPHGSSGGGGETTAGTGSSSNGPTAIGAGRLSSDSAKH